MSCCISELRSKEVVNVCDGRRFGYVCDVEVDVCEGKVVYIVVPGEGGGIFSKSEDIRIPWKCITHIGEDIILVDVKELPNNCCTETHKHKKIRFWE